MKIRRGAAAVIGQTPGLMPLHAFACGKVLGVVMNRQPEDLPFEISNRYPGTG